MTEQGFSQPQTAVDPSQVVRRLVALAPAFL
jgi:hypothetical protein